MSIYPCKGRLNFSINQIEWLKSLKLWECYLFFHLSGMTDLGEFHVMWTVLWCGIMLDHIYTGSKITRRY